MTEPTTMREIHDSQHAANVTGVQKGCYAELATQPPKHGAFSTLKEFTGTAEKKRVATYNSCVAAGNKAAAKPPAPH